MTAAPPLSPDRVARPARADGARVDARRPTGARRAGSAAALLAAVAVVAVAPSASAQAQAFEDDFPRRRAGLWEIDTVGASAAGLPPAQYCIDEATDRAGLHLDRAQATRGACSFGAFRRAGQAWVSETVCREGRTKVTTRSVASGDFRQAYRIDTEITYDPPLAGVRREERTATVGRWLGPCAPGQRAGDMTIPGMGRLNMNDGSVVPDEPARKAPARRQSTRQADG